MKFFRDAWPVVVIVATIAGVAWTAAWNLRDFLAAQIAASENRLAAQIAASENRLAARIAASETGLAAQTARIATSENRLAARIAASETGLAARIAASETELAAQIATRENRLAAQIAASENRLAENDAHLAGQIAELRQYLVDHLGDHAGRGSTPSLARGAMLRTEERAGTDATARLPAVQVLRAGNRTEERAGTDATAGGGRRCPRGPGADADDQRRRRPCPDIQPAGRHAHRGLAVAR